MNAIKDLMDTIEESLIKHKQDNVISILTKYEKDQDAGKYLADLALCESSGRFLDTNSDVCRDALDWIYGAIDWTVLAINLRDCLDNLFGNCRCGEQLPWVAMNETPYQFCSTKCACAEANLA